MSFLKNVSITVCSVAISIINIFDEVIIQSLRTIFKLTRKRLLEDSNVLLDMKTHLIYCIMHRSIRLIDKIHGIKLEINHGSGYLKDIIMHDCNICPIIKTVKTSNNVYKIDPSTPFIVIFQQPIHLIRIEFVDLVLNNEIKNALVKIYTSDMTTKNNKYIETTVSSRKNIICNTEYIIC